jgi:hypothetical protein
MWKKPKTVYRINCRWQEQNDAENVWFVDVLPDDLDADLVTDFYCFYDWLYWDAHTDWEVIGVEEVEIWSWGEFHVGRWRGFYKNFGFGDELHV